MFACNDHVRSLRKNILYTEVFRKSYDLSRILVTFNDTCHVKRKGK